MPKAGWKRSRKEGGGETHIPLASVEFADAAMKTEKEE
jgi:hypothetical protein